MNNYFQKIKAAVEDYFKDPFFLRRWERPYYRVHGRNDNQLSVRGGNYSAKLYHYHGAGDNLVRHLYTGIMPLSHMVGQREKYPAKAEPVSPEKTKLIAAGLSQRGHRTSLENALYNFVETTSHTLFMYGIKLFEVVYEKDEAGNITSFHFEHLDAKYVFRFLGNYYQIIPWWIARQSHARVQIVKIPATKVMRIELSKKLGGRQKMQRMLKRLWELSKEITPQFQIDAMKANTDIGFDFEHFQRGKYLESAKVTNKFGWNQELGSTNYVTEYYWFLRHLRKVKAQAIVRADILDCLNDFLNGPILNLGVRVSIENLPTVESIEEQEQLMKSGDIKFMDIYNATKI